MQFQDKSIVLYRDMRFIFFERINATVVDIGNINGLHYKVWYSIFKKHK